MEKWIPASPAEFREREVAASHGDGKVRRRSEPESTAPSRLRCRALCPYCSTGFFLFPWGEERPPLIGDRDRLSFVRYRYIHDKRIQDDRIALIPYFLPHYEAGGSDRRESRPDAEIVARESLRQVGR